MKDGNLFADLPAVPQAEERFDVLLRRPGDLSGALGLELVEERLRVVVVDEQDGVAGGDAVERGEDARVALARGDVADVDRRFGGHGVLQINSWSQGMIARLARGAP